PPIGHREEKVCQVRWEAAAATVTAVPCKLTPPKLDANEIKVVYLRCTGGKVGATPALVPKIGPLGLSPKKVGGDIAKATGNPEQPRSLWKASSHYDIPQLAARFGPR
ncbi:hypothetical protein U0070_013219, partial [Myodes glareolus]